MRMKMFAAETFDAAKALAFAEMGDDAVILSEREVDGRVEVRAAIDRGLGGANEPLFLKTPDAAAPDAQSPLRHRLFDALAWHGAPTRFAARVADAGAASGADAPLSALSAGLEPFIDCDPTDVSPERNLLLVGPPGHGRTATAAKLTRRAAVAGADLSPVAADFDATAGGAQLTAYLERESALVRAVATPDQLFDLLDGLAAARMRCVIDLPAISPFDTDDLARLSDLVAAIDAEPLLVLSAEGHPEDLADAARAFAGAGVKRAILTKLDVVRRRGGAVAALSSAGLAFSHLSVTPFIGGGLVPAAPERLAGLLMEDAPGQAALKGAAQ